MSWVNNCPIIKIEFSRTLSKNLGSTAGSRDCQIVRGSPKDSGTKLVRKLTRNPIYGEVKIQSITDGVCKWVIRSQAPLKWRRFNDFKAYHASGI